MVGRQRRRAGDAVAQGIAAQCFLEPAGAQLPRGLAYARHRNAVAARCAFPHRTLPYPGVGCPPGWKEPTMWTSAPKAARVEPAARAPGGPSVVVHGRLLRGRGGAGAIDGDVELAPMAPLPHHRRPAVRADDPMRPTSVFGGC